MKYKIHYEVTTKLYKRNPDQMLNRKLQYFAMLSHPTTVLNDRTPKYISPANGQLSLGQI